MPIRTNTNPRPLELTPELQDILLRNGMQSHVAASSNGFALLVQGHDSPLLNYPITEKQLKALTDWGTNTANRKAYNTFASIVAADFDMPKDFVHARQRQRACGDGTSRLPCRCGRIRQGRTVPPLSRTAASHDGLVVFGMDAEDAGRIPPAPHRRPALLSRRTDGAEPPRRAHEAGELQSGGYGFYYKGYNTAPVAEKDVLAELQTVITPVRQPQRPTTPAIPYKEAITSDVYFSNEKWQEVLASHGILVDAEKKTVTIQSSALEADLQYNLSDEELAVLTSNSIKDQPIAKRLETLNNVIKEDFADAVTMDMLNSDKLIDIKLHPEVQADLDRQITRQDEYYRQEIDPQEYQVEREPSLRDNLPKGGVVMDGNDLNLIDENKGWFREGTARP